MKPPESSLGTALAWLPLVLLVAACSGGSLTTALKPDAQVPPTDASTTAPTFCGRGADVPGATVPAGFCLKAYAQTPEARSITFAPNGDLFIGAPSMDTPGGANGGPGAILVLTDANHDGIAETHTFLKAIDAKTTLADVHAVALGGGFLYFTTKDSVWRTPYVDGQLVASAPPVSLGLPDTFGTGGRWTHGLALSKGGQLLASRGVYASCGSNEGGEISAVSAAGALTTVAAGFRNPMYMRCHAKDEVCAAMELGEDNLPGAREKMLIMRATTANYGYPCCTTTSMPVAGFVGDSGAGGVCDDIAKEDASFPLSNTPFGFDWEPGGWPAPFTGAIFVALHGSAYSSPPWQGEGIVYAPTDPTTHAPTQDWQKFLGGFSPDPSNVLHRPADIAFAPDGRMFFADDTSGRIFWMAPTTLMVPGTAN